MKNLALAIVFLGLLSAFPALAQTNTFPASGNAGIGTTTPSLPLEIHGSADILSLVTTGNIGAGMVLDASVNSGHKYHLYSTTSAAGQGAGYLLITDETASWADRLVINSSGHVGIGTTTAPDLLDINGGLGLTTTTSTKPANGFYSPTANQLAFTTSGAAALTLTSTGWVGIGTTSPNARLHVNGNSRFGGDPTSHASTYISDGGLGVDSANYIIWEDTGRLHQLSIGQAVPGGSITNDMLFSTSSGSWSEKMRLTNGGNLGIGTATPAQTLEVNGKIKVDSFAAASATTVCQNANVLSTCSSSIRYKEKMKPATFGLKEVMEMRPVTFKWKGRDENDLGLVAEEMEKVNPLFVTYARGQIEGVKYSQLTAVLVKAVQEQEAKIDALEAEVAALKARPGQN